MSGRIQEILESEAQSLLSHQCKTIPKEQLHLPGPDFIDRVHMGSDRPARVLVSLQQLFGSGRLAKTGFVSILPLAQGFDQSVGATIYFGSEESKRQLQEITEMFHQAHELGMYTVLWCYLRNSAFKTKDADYHVSADLTGQANHLGVTIEADIIKQKLPENNGGFVALNSGGVSYGKFDDRIYSELASDHPIDLCRYQVANCYMGRAGLLNSG